MFNVKDKLDVRHKPTMVTWDTFGLVQRVIRREYSDGERNRTVPTFREFIKFLVRMFILCIEKDLLLRLESCHQIR